ncbi:MAG: hypothetical protein ACLQU2_00055 [Candidatus Binataceae bacterium]
MTLAPPCVLIADSRDEHFPPAAAQWAALQYAARYQPFQPGSTVFDEVLAFSAEKGLRARSLEELAAEVGTLPLPALEVSDTTTTEATEIAV